MASGAPHRAKKARIALTDDQAPTAAPAPADAGHTAPQESPPLVPPQHMYVRLDVGGTHYTTLLSTLCKHPESMLAAMFRGLCEESGAGAPTVGFAQDPTGVYIIDRDGPCFRHVLNYLRHDGPGEPPIPLGQEERRLLALEAEYFMLPGLAMECRLPSSPTCRNLSRVNLAGRDLGGRNFEMFNLSYANLRNAGLQGANLRYANLTGADLTCADLTGADLGKAILMDAKLRTPETRLDGVGQCWLEDDRDPACPKVHGIKPGSRVLAKITKDKGHYMWRTGEVCTEELCFIDSGQGSAFPGFTQWVVDIDGGEKTSTTRVILLVDST